MSWLPKNNVVVPIDFSGNSVDAIATALELVDGPAGVHAIHVVVPLGNMSPGMEWGSIDDKSREEAALSHFSEFLEKHGFSNVNTVVRVGDPGLEISEYATETNADLIVVPSHGFHGLKRMILGSVAERVIRHAECPVLVLRLPDAG